MQRPLLGSNSQLYRRCGGHVGIRSFFDYIFFYRLSNLIFLADGVTPNPSSLGQPYGGRVTITGTAVGEESFPDTNGNGRFDDSELAAFLGNNTSGLPYDLDEAYTDYNEDGFLNPFENDPDEQDCVANEWEAIVAPEHFGSDKEGGHPESSAFEGFARRLGKGCGYAFRN